VKTEVLLAALERASQFVQTTDTGSGLSCVRIEKGILVAADGIVATAMNLTKEPEMKALDCLIPMQPLLNVVKTIVQEDVSVKHIPGTETVAEQVQIKTTGMTCKLDTVDVRRFRRLPLLDIPATYEDMPEDFLAGIAACKSTMSKDPYSGALQGVLASPEGFEATNGVQISTYATLLKPFKTRLVIPARAVGLLLKLGSTIETLAFQHKKDGTFLAFKDGEGSTFFCGTLSADDFPDVTDSINSVKGFKGRIPVTENLVTMLQRHNAIQAELPLAARKTEIRVTKADIRLRSNCSLKGVVEDRTSCKAGKAFAFKVNPQLIMGSIELCNELRFNPANNKIIGVCGDAFTSVVALWVPEAELADDEENG